MRAHLIVMLSAMVLAPMAMAQLPRVGSEISSNERLYFGIGLGRGNFDSMKVVKKSNIMFIGYRRDSVVDTITFLADEIPALERYFANYERTLTGGRAAFVQDRETQPLLTRLFPYQHHQSGVQPVSLRLMDGSIKTGVPLAATDENLLLSTGSSFSPEADLHESVLDCIPVTDIDIVTADVGHKSPRWFLVRGDYNKFRTSIGIICPTRVYARCVPPEAEKCMPLIMDDLGQGVPLHVVCPRSVTMSISAFSGIVASVYGPDASVVLREAGRDRINNLSIQPITYSSGIEVSFFVSQLFDLGLRGLVQVQPSTTLDATPQHSLGFDSYSLQCLGTWHIIHIDSAGYNSVGVSTTFALGGSLIDYRARTHVDSRNLTTIGTGLAFDLAWNTDVTFAVSRSFAVGVRGFVMFQHGLEYSINGIVHHHQPFEPPVLARFAMPWQSAPYLGAQVFATFTID